MKNKWIQFLFGFVTVRIIGEGLEEFINGLTHAKLPIWDVRRGKGQTVFFKMSLGDINRLRKIKRSYPCKVFFHKRSGIPFLWLRLKKNSGFLIGALLFLGLIFGLSNMVWKIEVTGAQPDTAYKIEKKLEEYGVTEGSFQLFTYTPEQLQQKLTNDIEELTWIGVEFKGTAYYLTVVEKTEPDPVELIDPRNLVAKKKAVIVNMFIEEGQPLVSVNDYVKPGQLLVSGWIGKPETPQLVASKGVVWGETWYKSDVEMNQNVQLDVLSGKTIKKWRINLFGWDIPIWGFEKVEFNSYQLEEEPYLFELFGRTFPIIITKQTLLETEKLNHSYSMEEAVEVAIQIAKEDLERILPEDAYIKGEKILHKSMDNGKVKVSVHFQVIENIAIAQPIIQGET